MLIYCDAIDLAMNEINSPNSIHSAKKNQISKDQFLYPRSRYRGTFTPQNLAFNANLQEFSQRVSYLCGLGTNGKLLPEDVFQQVKQLYKDLKLSSKALGIGSEPPASPR